MAYTILIYGDAGGSGGYVQYCRGLLSSSAIPDDVAVYFVASHALIEKIGPVNRRVRLIGSDWIGSDNRLKRYAWNLFIYPLLAMRINADVEFYAAGLIRRLFGYARTVVTCHNMLLFDDTEIRRIPDTVERQGYLSGRRRHAASFQSANGIIFLSEHSRRQVLMHLGLDAAGISTRVIAHGLERRFLSEGSRDYSLGSTVRVLYVSTIYHYKNHIQVVDAVRRIRDKREHDVRLTLVGDTGASSASRDLRDFIDAHDLGECVSIVPFVDEDALLRAYAENDIFVFASSCETFGITLLEAMGAGLPIACSNTAAMPEVLSSAGAYFDPFDASSIEQAIVDLITDDARRRRLGETARGAAAEFSWNRCAERTFAYLKEIADTRRRLVISPVVADRLRAMTRRLTAARY